VERNCVYIIGATSWNGTVCTLLALRPLSTVASATCSALTLVLLPTQCIYRVRINIAVFLHIFTGFGNVKASTLRAGRSGSRIPVEARFSAHVQTGPGAHPASYTMGTGSFVRVKRPGRGVDHPPHLAPRLKKE
jgi:hypothetical protein